jgi:RNA polymerase sigma-70 factor (ECF subfamily)
MLVRKRALVDDQVVLDDDSRQDDVGLTLLPMATPSQQIVPMSPQSDASDADLVHAARAGDRRACFSIWSKYAALVQRLIRRFLGPGVDHADIRQEVFLRIFKRLDEVRDPAALRGFVISVCLGVTRNEARRRRIRSIVGFTPEELLPEPTTSSGQTEAREAARALYQLLGTLSAEDRSLFVSRFIEKMEMVEVASAHDMSLSTAKRRVARLVERVNARVQSSPVLTDYVGRFGQGETS